MSELKVDKITPRQGTTLTLGDAGDTINFGSGVLPNFENLTVTGDLTVDTNSLKVDSTNNFVGIGTASPSVALDVVGAITATGNITGTLATAAQPNITSVGTLTSATVSGDLTVDTNTLSVDSTNNRVGIGTTAPAHNVEIVATASGSINDSLQIRNNATATGTGSRIRFINSTDKNSDTNGASIASVRNGDDNDLVFETENSEAMRIDHAGNVGIGTSSPSEELHIYKNTTNSVDLKIENSEGTATLKANNDGLYIDADNHIFRSEASSEYMRIDSSGNVLVGKTSTTFATAGVNLQPNGRVDVTRDGGQTVYFNRTTSDGNIVGFYKDGTEVGTINAKDGDIAIGTGDTALRFSDSTESLYPFNNSTNGGRDNAIDLGLASVRWKDLYLGGSIINSGNFIVDVSGNIRLDADDAGEVRLLDGGTQYGALKSDSSRLKIQGIIQDQDILVVGNDGGVETTALSFDMSEGGRAIFYGGVALGGTGAANTLDDYEEGTFTPTLEGSSSNPTVTYGVRYGRYTKIGDTVTFQCCVKLSSISGGSGEVVIDGLPFSPADISGFKHPTFATFIVQKPNTDVYASLIFSSSKIFFRKQNSTSDNSLPFSAVDGDTGFFVTGNYKTNS